MAMRVQYRPASSRTPHSSHPNPARGQGTHAQTQRRNGPARSYSLEKNSHRFPVGVPSQPVEPGHADFYHFEKNLRDHLSGRTTLTFDELKKTERDNDISLNQLFKEVQKLNDNFDKLFNFLEKSDKKTASKV